MTSEALHYLVLNLDIEQSGRRTDDGQLNLHGLMYALLADAFETAGIPPDDREVHDRGDGVLILVPPTIPKSRMLGIWVEELYQGLRIHNHPVDRRAWTRLRLGIHAGEVHRDPNGVVGTAVNTACRLAESKESRAVFAVAHAAQLMVVVSDVLYHSVVRQGGRFLEPECYRRIGVRNKELEAPAWVYLPGYSTPPTPPEDAQGAGPTHADADRAGERTAMAYFERGQFSGDFIFGGTKNQFGGGGER